MDYGYEDDMLPPLTGDGTDGFPPRDEFNIQMEDYLDGLNPKKRAKALMTEDMYSTILSVLLEPHSTAYATAQFRFWSKRMFRLVATQHANIVTHENRPVAVKNQIYNILVGCHGDAAHGGRDKTSAQVRRFYSWIPKELVSRFVKMCPYCISKRRSQKPYLSDSLLPESLAPEFPLALRRARPVVAYSEVDSPEDYSPDEHAHQHYSTPHHSSSHPYSHSHPHSQPPPQHHHHSSAQQHYDGQTSYEYALYDNNSSPTSQIPYDASLPSTSFSDGSSASSSSLPYESSHLQLHGDHTIVHDPNPPPFYSTVDSGQGIPSFSLGDGQIDFSQALARWNAGGSYACDSFPSAGENGQDPLANMYALPPTGLEGASQQPRYDLDLERPPYPYEPARYASDQPDRAGNDHDSDEEANSRPKEHLQQPWEHIVAGIDASTAQPFTVPATTPQIYRRGPKPPPLDLGRTSNLFPSLELLRLSSAGLPPDSNTGHEDRPYTAPAMQASTSNTSTSSSQLSSQHLYPYSLHSPGPLSSCSSISSNGLSLPLTPATSVALTTPNSSASDSSTWQQTSKDLAQAIQNLLDSTEHMRIPTSDPLGSASSSATTVTMPTEGGASQEGIPQFALGPAPPERERQRTRTRTMSANQALSPAVHPPATVERRGSASHALDMDRSGLRTPRRDESRYSPY